MSQTGSWPSPSEYSTAIQNPQNCFNDPELRQGKPRTNSLGLPLPASGNFAVVYQLQCGAKTYAVRCFIRPVTDQQDRYNALSQHLSGFSLPALVDFAYLPQGIRVRGQWHPIVRMEWITGEQMHHYIEHHLRSGQALGRLAAQWRGVVAGLSGSHSAHGDLQHGNILIDGQGIRLVDYDGFFIPILRGRPPGEKGHPNYQHPERIKKGYYDEGVDAFSALVIYLSLLALKADPSLWTAFHTGENLIFSEDDFKAPGQTPIWGRLKMASDQQVQQLTAVLEKFCQGSVSSVLPLETVLQGPQKTPVSLPAVPGSGASGWVKATPSASSSKSSHFSSPPSGASISQEPKSHRMPISAIASIALVGVVLLGGLALSSLGMLSGLSPTPTIIAAITAATPVSASVPSLDICLIPDVVGRSQAEAEEILLQVGLQPVKSYLTDPNVASGTVISQDPAASTRLEPCKGEVTIQVSLVEPTAPIILTTAPTLAPTFTPFSIEISINDFKHIDIAKPPQCGPPSPEAVPLKDDKGLYNLALLKQAVSTASSLIPGYPDKHQIQYFNDGWYNNCRSWIPDKMPAWIEVDLGDEFIIEKIVFGSEHTAYWKDRAATNFSIKLATSSQYPNRWLEVLSYNKSDKPIQRTTAFEFEPTRARYVHIDFYASDRNNVRIDEVEIYGKR